MLEDIVQIPVVENPQPEEDPAELPSNELPEVVTLPEPPVEVEASGSGDLEEHFQPTAPTKAGQSFEEIESNDGMITRDVNINADAVLEAETEALEVAEVREEPTAPTLGEEHLNGEEIQEKLDISTVASKTLEEEDITLPVTVLSHEPRDVSNDALKPASEMGPQLIDNNSAESEEDSSYTGVALTDKEGNSEQPAEDAHVEEPTEHADFDVMLTSPEIPVLEEDGVGEATDYEGRKVMEETLPDAAAVVTEGSEAPQTFTEDLAEDEILLVNQDEPEPPQPDVPSPAKPTALSAERESSFTRISDINPVTEGHPHTGDTSLVVVMHLYSNAKSRATPSFTTTFQYKKRGIVSLSKVNVLILLTSI